MPYKPHIAHRLLNSLGFQLNRRPQSISALQSHRHESTSGKILEFIGTQGIGKTTLHNAVHKNVRHHWFFRHDILRTQPQNIGPNAAERLHRELFFLGLRRIKTSSLDAWQATTKSRQMSEVIRESLIISTHEFPRGFLLEEGLFKNFSAEVLALISEDAACLWENRAFIYLRARNIEVAKSRFKKRTENRRQMGLSQHCIVVEELHAKIEEDNRLFDRMFEMAQSLGCPAILIYAEDDFMENINKILEFENSLRQ